MPKKTAAPDTPKKLRRGKYRAPACSIVLSDEHLAGLEAAGITTRKHLGSQILGRFAALFQDFAAKGAEILAAAKLDADRERLAALKREEAVIEALLRGARRLPDAEGESDAS